MRKIPLVLLAVLPIHVAFAAPAPPGTDVWLVDLSIKNEDVDAANPRNLTARSGYDNQPHFITAHSFLFTSMDNTGQTDVWRYELSDSTAAPLSQTPESEYSPTPAPEGAVSVVRVSLSGVQQLWTLAPGETEFEVLFPMLEGVGYHAWLDGVDVAMFMVTDPAELHVGNRSNGEVVKLAKDIGRSLQPVPDMPGSLAFTEPGSDGKRWIKRLDFYDRRITPLAPLPDENEDFIFLPDGKLVIANGRALNVWNGNEWQEFARFENLPGDITRLAVSPDAAHLAMVVDEAQ